MRILSCIVVISLFASVASAGPMANIQEFQEKIVDQAAGQGEEKMSRGSGSDLIQMSDDSGGAGQSGDANAPGQTSYDE